MKPQRPPSAWESWRQRQRFKRRWIAWGSAVGTAVLALGLAFWGGFPAWLTLGEKGEALAVKLGNPEGEDLPLSVSALPDPSMQAVLEAQRHSALNTVEETRAVPEEPGPAPAPKKLAVQKPATTKPAPSPTPTPVESKPSEQPPQPVVTEKVIRGSEKGNSSELILKPQGEKISQNAYWPVYLFMPLPAKLDAGLLARVASNKLYSADERKALLLQYYSKSGDGLVRTNDPDLPVRPALWEVLESAGYDVANADYKKGKDLTPVVITFELGIPASSNDNPELRQVHLDQSSGNDQVDEAVLYAFKKSTFANGTGQVAQGRYTYDFTAPK